MKIDISNITLDEVSKIVQRFERIGYEAKMERSEEKLLLIFDRSPAQMRLPEWQ